MRASECGPGLERIYQALSQTRGRFLFEGDDPNGIEMQALR
ncbi:hypothetical protein B4091_2789 [Bacillus licheniformis]|nr:hypothetical protein B4091_2789 [Bacillus licheniformis]